MNTKQILLTLGLLAITTQSIFADVNQTLLAAAKKGNLADVKTALENKANINTQDPNGYSALLTSVEKNFVEIVDYLLQNDANPDIKAQLGTTPLLAAAGNNNLVCVVLLLAAGANPTLAQTINYLKKAEKKQLVITSLSQAINSGKIPELTAKEKANNLAIIRILKWAESFFSEESESEDKEETVESMISSREESSHEEDNSSGEVSS